MRPRLLFLSPFGLEFLSLCASFVLLVGCSQQVSPIPTTADGRSADQNSNDQNADDNTEAQPSQIKENDTLRQIPGLQNNAFHASLVPVLEREDPSDDGWDSEVVAAKIGEQLNVLGKCVIAETNGQHELRKPLDVEKEFRGTFSRNDLSRVYDEEFTVQRAPKEPSPGRSLNQVLADLADPLRDAVDVRFKFKVFKVATQDNDTVESSAYYQASGTRTDGVVQQNAIWHCLWNTTSITPRLKQLTVDDYVEVLPKKSSSLSFSDVTQSAVGSIDSFKNQLSRGVDYWRGRLEANYGVDPNGNQGLAIGDINGDGLDDLFVCQQGGLPNRMYVQQPDGTLQDVSSAAGVDWMEVCRSALLVDIDNDGDQDLIMAQGWYAMVMANDGSGKFTTRQQTRSEANLYSTAAADYDEDGDLDLFFCGRNPSRERGEPRNILGTPIPYHDANNGGPNLFWQNDGHGNFSNETVAAGLDVNNRRYSYAASWVDFDNDGDLDLYVANDFGRNNLYENQLRESGKATFLDVAAKLGVEDISAGMSVSWGDYNNDGLADAYVSNMFSSAGNRIAYQRRFRQDDNGSLKSFQRHARGNTLFQNVGQGFRDVSVEAGVTMGRWAWGSKFADLNNDGRLDIYVTNGFITTEDTGDL